MFTYFGIAEQSPSKSLSRKKWGVLSFRDVLCGCKTLAKYLIRVRNQEVMAQQWYKGVSCRRYRVKTVKVDPNLNDLNVQFRLMKGIGSIQDNHLTFIVSNN